MNKMTNVTKTTESTDTVVTATSATSKIQRKYKDTLFSMLFNEKENLLSLYNALNKTAYTKVDDLEITTLENALYMNYKNDISFVFDFELMLYEHQSTINPNMPLRDLFYVSTVLKGRVRDENLYGQALIKIPAPRFVVLYNGTDEQPEYQILKLSDSYEKKQENPELELTVVVYNINWGHNEELLEACQLLKEYAQFVNQVREYAGEASIKEAVEKAVDYCIENNILADFLSKYRMEAVDMCIFEFNEEKFLKSEREWSYNNGYEAGLKLGREEAREEGRKETLIKNIETLMKNLGIDLQKACESLGISVEEYHNAKEKLTVQ